MRAGHTLCTLMLGVLVGCSAAEEKVTLTSAQRADTMSNVLLELQRTQLTSSDPMREEPIIGCELERLIYLVGVDSAMKISEVSRLRLAEIATGEERLAVQAKLGGRERAVGVGCDSLAAAGMLGGPFVAPSPATPTNPRIPWRPGSRVSR